MSDNMKVWDALRTPPPESLKKIQGGRLKGMTDISPQWRYKAMTEQFGTCGVGWTYKTVRLFSEPGSDGQIFAFAEIELYTREKPDITLPWSSAIPGSGGSMLIAKEKAGLHSSDEAYKMAVTDALSVAMKMIGVGADVYMGMMDSKHTGKPAEAPATTGKATGKEGEETPEETDHRKRTLLWKIMLKMTYDIVDDARKELKVLSGFEGKDGWVDGKETVADLKGQRLAITLRSAEKEYEAWKEKEVPAADPEQSDIEF